MDKSDLLISKSNFVETKNNQNILEFYDFEKVNVQKSQEIGKGAYGVVYRAREKNNEGRVRAVKKIIKKTVKNPQYLSNQIQSLIELDHPTILKVYEVF